MRLVSSSDDVVVAAALRRVEAPALSAVPVGIIALLPWIGDGPMTLPRTLTSAALGALAAYLARTLWSRPSRVVIDRREGSVETARGRLPLSAVRGLALTHHGGVVGQPHGYALTLELEDGGQQLLSAAEAPEPVLEDLERVLAVLDLPVRTGWGLPAPSAPWRPSPPLAVEPPDPAPPLVLRPQHRQDGLELTLGVSVPTLAVLAPWLIRDHWALPWSAMAPPPTHALSFVLPLALLGCFAAVAWLTRRHRIHVSGRSPVVLERRGSARNAWTRAVAAGELCGAWPVSPDGGEPRHVLVRTTRELFSVPCAPDDAPRLTRRLLGG